MVFQNVAPSTGLGRIVRVWNLASIIFGFANSDTDPVDWTKHTT